MRAATPVLAAANSSGRPALRDDAVPVTSCSPRGGRDVTDVLDLTKPKASPTNPGGAGPAVLPEALGSSVSINPSEHLPAVLVALDLLGALLAWVTVLVIGSPGSWPARVGRGVPIALTLSALMLLLIAAQKLYLPRAITIRAVEVAGVGRAAGLCALVAIGLHEVEWAEWVMPSAIAALLGGIGAFVAIAYLRGTYSKRLRARRARGGLTRPVCVLGANDEAERLVRLFEDQPELGYRVIAVLGDAATWAARGLDVPAVDPGEESAVTARALGATGMIVALSAIDAQEIDGTIRKLSVWSQRSDFNRSDSCWSSASTSLAARSPAPLLCRAAQFFPVPLHVEANNRCGAHSSSPAAIPARAAGGRGCRQIRRQRADFLIARSG